MLAAMTVHNQKPAVAVVYMAALFMSVLDTTIVNVALPVVGRDLHASGPGSVALVSVAYLTSLAVLMPASGWLGDRFGGRTTLLCSVALFTVGSALCGVAPSLGLLIVFRVLQGAGAAVMTPVGLAMLFRVYPPAERVRVSALIAGISALGPALGPVVGGLLTSWVSWRLVFFVNVPVGLATLLYGMWTLHPHRTVAPERPDAAGLLLSAVGLGSLMYAVSTGGEQGWAAPAVLVPLIVGLVCLIALVIVELRIPDPLLDLRLLGNRMFACATSLYGLASVPYLGVLFLAALFLQDGLGTGPVRSGLAVFPSALGVLVGGQLVSRLLYRRFGPRPLATTGLLVIAAALAALAGTGDSVDLRLVGVLMAVLGLGVSFVFIPSQVSSMATVEPERTGRASAIFTTGKQLGGAVGVSLVGTVTALAGTGTDGTGAYHVAFLVAAAVAVLAVPVALCIRNADAHATR